MVPRRMARLVAVSFAFVTTVAAQQVLEGAEPNSTIATATALTCGAEALGNLASAGDVDWYALTLTGVTDLRLETGPGAAPQIGDTMLTVLDSFGAPLLFNDNGVGCGNWSRLYRNGLAAGTYFVAVERGPAGAAAGSYTLDVRCAAPGVLAVPGLVAEGPESNDPRLGGTATTITLPARCNGVISSTGATGDWDFYRFTLTNETFVRVRVDGTATHPQQPAMDDPILYLHDAATPPNLLAGPFYASNFGVWDTAIDVRLAPGTYQVGIRGWVGSVAGRYYLDVRSYGGAAAAVASGGCGGRGLTVGISNSGPGAPSVIERPVLGTTYSLLGQGLGASGVSLHLVGFVPLAIDLTGLGAPGCTLAVDYVSMTPQIADALGNARWPVAIPESPALVGIVAISQAAVLDYSNPLGLTFSNAVTSTLGD